MLPSSTALKTYPRPLPVPLNIRRPSYVPSDFFPHEIRAGNAKSPPSNEDDGSSETQIELGGEDEKAVRKVARMAAEVLRDIGKFVKVCSKFKFHLRRLRN